MNRKFGAFCPRYLGCNPPERLVDGRSRVISLCEMSLHEIVLPETKPETEWVRGRPVQKVSPTYWHAALQTVFAAALREWAQAGGFGRVGTEWRFRVAPPGAVVRPLVPDVAFLSFEALPRNAAPELFQIPLGAPTVAIEILSEDDRPHDVADKIATYLASGSAAVVIVDPHRVEIDARENSGMRTLVRGDVFAHRALPDFQLDLTTFFDRALR
jgi:Uma2 family endonuclease